MDMATLAVLGVAVTILVQFIKVQFGTSKTGTQLAVLALSVVFALGYFLLVHLGFWEAFVKILGVAVLIYEFIIQHGEDAGYVPK